MVIALLAGKKTMTRRVLNPQPEEEYFGWNGECQGRVDNAKDANIILLRSPKIKKAVHVSDAHLIYNEKGSKYQIGDLLYVKESYYAFGKWVKNGLTKKGSQKFKFVDLTPDAYLYNYNPPKHIHKGKTEKIGWYKKPSLFMPKAAAKIWLKVTGVKCERLQDITADDAIAEGIKKIEGLGYKHYTAKKRFTKEALKDGCPFLNSPILSFLTLWESIYGDESLKANPWVFAYSFEVISTTGAPIKNS